MGQSVKKEGEAEIGFRCQVSAQPPAQKMAGQIEKETFNYRAKTQRRQDYLYFKFLPLRAWRLCVRLIICSFI
jgi:hypothetical protein